MPSGGGPPAWVLTSWNCSFELLNSTTTFGKEESDCLIPFRSVSKHHAVIMWDNKKGHYKIKEAPFSLGTFVNDSRIGVRSIVLLLGDTIRFGADSPTFRLEVREKEKEFISPRKTFSTVHDVEEQYEEEWPEQMQTQTMTPSTPFVAAPSTRINTTKSPLIRASRDYGGSNASFGDTVDSTHVINKPSITSKGSALYGQPQWWGEEAHADRHRTRTVKTSGSTEFDPFDRHDYASEYENGYRRREKGDHHRDRNRWSGVYENNSNYSRSHGRRSVSPLEERRSYNPSYSGRQSPQVERAYTPPPKPGLAFQITFDEPKQSPHRGKKKRDAGPVEQPEVATPGDVNIKEQIDNDIDGQSSEKSEPELEEVAIKKELTKWANSVLRKRDYVPVFCIYEAVRDGRTLQQLLHCLADEKVSDLDKEPKLRVEILPNVDKCLKFALSHNLILGAVLARDIVKGNEIQITTLLEQLRAAAKRKHERPEIPVDKSNENKVSDSELTDDENVLPFRRNKTLAAPPRAKRVPNNIPTAPLQELLIQTLNELTLQLKSKIDKSAVYSLHIKDELECLAGNNAPDDFIPNTITKLPPPGSNNTLPDTELTQALQNLRFLERKLAEIEDNLVHIRNDTIPRIAKKDTEKKKKKKGLSMFKSKEDCGNDSGV